MVALIGITLFVMFMLVVFSLITGNSMIGTPVYEVISSELIDNGTSTVVDFSVVNGVFGVTELSLGIGMIAVILAVAVGFSVQVVGTGLSENGSRMIIYSAFYVSLWVILSLLAEPLISSIDVFGSMIYMLLTVTYVVGIMKSYFGGDG